MCSICPPCCCTT